MTMWFASWLLHGFDSLATMITLHTLTFAAMWWCATADSSDYDRYWMIPGY